MRRLAAVLAAALAAAPAVGAASCSSNEHGGFCTGFCVDAAASDASSPPGDGPRDGPPMFVGDHGAPKSVSILPASSTLQVTNLSTLPDAQLTAQVLYTDGTTSTVAASWTVDRFDIASIGAGTGLVQPTGTVFGKVNVTAQAFGLTGTTTITVSLRTTANLSNIPSGDASQLASATTPDPAVTGLAYPYDQTVFPGGLVAPQMMWNLSSAGDEYLVHYVSPVFDLSVLTTADPPSRFTLPTSLWSSLTASVAGGKVTVTLSRLPAGGTAYLSATETWTIAAANLRGIVYFWSISQGAILQADPTTGQVTPVFDPGPFTLLGNPPPQNQSQAKTPPWENNGTGDRCVACHAVSKDGSTLAATFSTGGSEGPSGYVGLQSRLVSAIGDYTSQGMFTAVAPDGALSVMNTTTRSMHLLDGTTGLPIASALDGLTGACDPAFSPDGTLFALSANCSGGTGQVLEFSSSDLVIYDFAEPTRTFANPRTILASGAAGSTLAFPSFSPDSKWIFFQGGSYSRAKYGTNLHGYDDLYVVSAQPGATPIALDNANGTNLLPPDSQHLEYAPTVSPIVQGGYFWVVFTTPRDYGNVMVSPEQAAPKDATYANHKQLWVAAVDATIGTTDPSHPAFWLPGQDSTTANMFGYWALAPCKPTSGDAGAPTCATGFECCSGFCRDMGSGPVCTANPGGCHQLGEVCTGSSDCCNAGPSVACLAGICQSYTGSTQ
jgi:hypothetical protein